MRQPDTTPSTEASHRAHMIAISLPGNGRSPRNTLALHNNRSLRTRMHRGISSLRIVVGLFSLGAAGAVAGWGAARYSRAQRADRAAGVVRWEITVARSYAVRTGRPMSLVLDEDARLIMLRDDSTTWRTVSLASDWRTKVDRIALEIDGDSLIFTPRGLCANCDPRVPVAFHLEAAGRSATVQLRRTGPSEVAALNPGTAP